MFKNRVTGGEPSSRLIASSTPERLQQEAGQSSGRGSGQRRRRVSRSRKSQINRNCNGVTVCEEDDDGEKVLTRRGTPLCGAAPQSGMTTIHHHQRLASSSSSSSSSSSLSSRRRRFAVKLRPVRIFRGGAYGVRNVEPWWNSWPESPRRMECSSHFCYAWTTQMACRTSHSPA